MSFISACSFLVEDKTVLSALLSFSIASLTLLLCAYHSF
jgi:hypothetical protein